MHKLEQQVMKPASNNAAATATCIDAHASHKATAAFHTPHSQPISPGPVDLSIMIDLLLDMHLAMWGAKAPNLPLFFIILPVV